MKYLLVILVLIISISCFSQEEKIKEIRKIYNDISKLIEEAKDPENLGGLYSNEIIVNSNNGSWRAVGIYKNHITFWYNDQPDFAVAQDMSATSVLLKITVSTESSVRKYYYEYVFDNDKLIFYYEVEKPGFDGNIENRYYFDNEKLIKYMEGSEKKEYKKDISPILKIAKEYKEMFLKTF